MGLSRLFIEIIVDDIDSQRTLFSVLQGHLCYRLGLVCDYFKVTFVSEKLSFLTKFIVNEIHTECNCSWIL